MSLNPRKGPSGRKVTQTAPTGGWTAGDLITIRSGTTGWVGEAIDDVAATEEGAVETGHQAYIPKNTGTGESWSNGALLYKDASTEKLTPTATGNDFVGSAVGAATTSDTSAWVTFAPSGGDS
jgi:hypothetical protein